MDEIIYQKRNAKDIHPDGDIFEKYVIWLPKKTIKI